MNRLTEKERAMDQYYKEDVNTKIIIANSYLKKILKNSILMISTVHQSGFKI